MIILYYTQSLIHSSQVLTESAAPPAQTPLQPISVNGRKRAAEEHTSSVPAKCSRHNTAAAGIHEVASLVCDLASAFKSSGGEASPVRQTAAIKLIKDDPDLSDNKLLKIFKVIRKDVTVADLILAMTNKAKHTRYIQSELEDV